MPEPTSTFAETHLAVVLAWNVFRGRRDKVPPWSRGTLARESGVSVKTIQNIEDQRDPAKFTGSLPDLDTVRKVAEGLGQKPADLLDTGRKLSGKRGSLAVIDGARTGDPPAQRSLRFVQSVPRP
jgi:hypothetical protein